MSSWDSSVICNFNTSSSINKAVDFLFPYRGSQILYWPSVFKSWKTSQGPEEVLLRPLNVIIQSTAPRVPQAPQKVRAVSTPQASKKVRAVPAPEAPQKV